MIELLLRYAHFLSIFVIISSLVGEHLLLKPSMTRSEVGRIARLDALYGVAALILLAAGLTLWLGGFGKPAAFYTNNSMFHFKLALFAAVGVMSIYPTVFFLRNRKGNSADTVEVPRIVFLLLRLEIGLVMIIPLLAGMMARGVGY